MSGACEYKMREPCKRCGNETGRLVVQSGQNCVFCLGCERFSYNAPKVETGEAVRAMSDRREIKPSQRARILARDHYRCRHCGRPFRDPLTPRDVPSANMHIGHAISVKDGRAAGLPDASLFADCNLMSLCELCNAGQGSRSYDPVEFSLLCAALHAHLDPRA